jgi:hypothetical protein
MSRALRTLPLLAVPLAAGAVSWRYRGRLASSALRRLAAVVSDPAGDRGLTIHIPTGRGAWIRTTLKADLGPALSSVVGHPLAGAAHSRFAGFHLSRIYSDFVNPDSPCYQSWVGAYVVFDGEQRKHFGFDEGGQPIRQEALDVLEADQRMVLGGAGCPHTFPGGRRVRLLGEMEVSQIESGGDEWWRLDGRAETWSAYHRGSARAGLRRAEAVYGRVPDDARHPVDDFHPLAYSGSFWQRYVPEWGATIARFYICPTYTTRDGRTIEPPAALVSECEEIVRGTVFHQK